MLGILGISGASSEFPAEFGPRAIGGGAGNSLRNLEAPKVTKKSTPILNHNKNSAHITQQVIYKTKNQMQGGHGERPPGALGFDVREMLLKQALNRDPAPRMFFMSCLDFVSSSSYSLFLCSSWERQSQISESPGTIGHHGNSERSRSNSVQP